MKLLLLILAKLKTLLLLDQELIKQKPMPDEIPPVENQPAEAIYLWDNPLTARHSVRLICDAMGLPYDQKNILCACLEVESGFNPKAIHENKDGYGDVLSTDYGIAQINSYWHIGEGKDFPSSEYVLENPEACVRWMVKEFLAGNQHLWTSYSKGLYKRYL